MHNEIEASSGNVFADLGLPDADALKRKSGLIVAMSEAIDRRGLGEEEAAQFLRDEAKRGRRKPMAGFIAGRTAPPGRTMGHAGAVISGGKGGAEDKIAAMEAAGIRVSPSPARLGKTLVEAIKGWK